MPEVGERLLLPCDGGPSMSRLVTFPPPVEVEVAGGVYVLVDDGPRSAGATSSSPPSPEPGRGLSHPDP